MRLIAPPHVHTGFPAVISATKAVVATSPAIVVAVGAMIYPAAADAAAEVVLKN